MIKAINTFNLISLLLYPTNGIFIKTLTNFGNLTIYFNNQINNKLVYDPVLNLYINTYSSAVYGYVNYNGNDYSVIFPTYDTPYIRTGNLSGNLYFTSMEQASEVNGLILYSKVNDGSYLNVIILTFLLFYFLGLKLVR